MSNAIKSRTRAPSAIFLTEGFYFRHTQKEYILKGPRSATSGQKFTLSQACAKPILPATRCTLESTTRAPVRRSLADSRVWVTPRRSRMAPSLPLACISLLSGNRQRRSFNDGFDSSKGINLQRQAVGPCCAIGHLLSLNLFQSQTPAGLEGFPWSLPVTVAARMGPLRIVGLQPSVQVGLQVLQAPVQFLSEEQAEALVPQGLVESSSDDVG